LLCIWGPELDTAALGTVPIIEATQGPFLGYAIVGQLSAFPLMPAIVRLNKTLFREGVFYEDQNGTDGISDRDPDTGMLYCNNATNPGWLDGVRGFVERHEGVTGAPNSHHVIWENAFLEQNPLGSFEAFVFPRTMPPDKIKMTIRDRFRAWAFNGTVAAANNALDSLDSTPSAFNNAAGCALDRDQSRGRGN
jgi:hypothetical protein